MSISATEYEQVTFCNEMDTLGVGFRNMTYSKFHKIQHNIPLYKSLSADMIPSWSRQI